MNANPLADNHSQRRVLFPGRVEDSRPFVDLLLSGGGYRAALFHIGLLRFLYEYRYSDDDTSLLQYIKRVIGISGGSLTAAHYALHAPQYKAHFSVAVSPLLTFITTTDVRRPNLHDRIPVADLLERLFTDAAFDSVQDRIRLDVVGTDYVSGAGVALSTAGLFTFADSQRPRAPSTVSLLTHNSTLRIRFAIAASAAFPPFFTPIVLEKHMFRAEATQKDLALLHNPIADGGIRDNLGVEYYRATCTARACIISDAGLLFDWDVANYVNQSTKIWAKRLLRVIDIQMNRILLLDSAAFNGDYYLPLDHVDHAPSAEDQGKSPFTQPLTQAGVVQARHINTDLVPLTRAQAYAIIRLGYDAACHIIAKQHAAIVTAQ